jgi:hypothetical protein
MARRLPSPSPRPADLPAAPAVGTIEVSVNPDSTRLTGTCPTCDCRLTVELPSVAGPGRPASCPHCKRLYQVRIQEGLPLPPDQRRGLGVSYAVEGEWDTAAIMEYLFDNVGGIDYVRGGFVCHPDEETSDFPSIAVDEQTRMVRFGLFGDYQDQEAGSIINQAVSEFGSRFQVEMRPLLLERWECRDGEAGFALVESRALGTLLKDPVKRPANA